MKEKKKRRTEKEIPKHTGWNDDVRKKIGCIDHRSHMHREPQGGHYLSLFLIHPHEVAFLFLATSQNSKLKAAKNPTNLPTWIGIIQE